jgi:hypothetical protein
MAHSRSTLTGLLGLVIAAIGTLGATLVHVTTIGRP